VALVVVQLCLHAVSAEVFTEWMRYDVTQLLAIRLYTLFDICLVHVCAKLQHSVYRPHLHCSQKLHQLHSLKSFDSSEYEVHSMLSSVKKTSPGIDGIPYWVFKHCAVELTPVVTYLINTVSYTCT